MFECEICKKNKVDDKGFRLFINRRIVSIMDISPKDQYPAWGSCTNQIRICDKCLKKKGKYLEIYLD